MTVQAIPARRSWDPPYRLKLGFVAVAFASILGLLAYKVYDRVAAATGRAMLAMEVEPMDRAAPDFELADVAGKKLKLSALRGKLVMVNFWATWCPPCRDEMPSMGQLARSLADEPFQMIAVSVDDDWEAIKKFFGGAIPEYDVLLDESQKIPSQWGTEKYPETYLVRDGRVIAKFTGPRDWNDPAAHRVIRSFLDG